MSIFGSSLLSIKSLETNDIEFLFNKARLYKDEFKKHGRIDHLVHSVSSSRPYVLMMVFFEPSTRTRVSFQMAAYRLGLRSIIFDSPTSSSLQKGETYFDTLKNLSAMKPDLMIVRYGDSIEVERVLLEMSCPVVNAGSGSGEHPTQALLDAFTLCEHLTSLQGVKILLVGDIIHSRVAKSNLYLLRLLGAEIGICGPAHLLPDSAGEWKSVQRFSHLDEGMKWCQVLMGLRLQKERHSPDDLQEMKKQRAEEESYRVESKHLRKLSTSALILHPGPVIQGEEFAPEVLSDSRCRVLTQVTNGLFIRAALYSMILGLDQ